MMIQALVLVGVFEAAFGLIAYAAHWVGPGGYIGISFTGGKIGGMAGLGADHRHHRDGGHLHRRLLRLTVPAAVGLAMSERGRRRWWWIGAAVVIFLGLLFTLSRTPIGLAALAVAVLLLAVTRPRVWVPVLVVGAVLFLLTPLRARMTDFNTDRFSLWRMGWRMFSDNWFFGVGPGQYVASLPAYREPGVTFEDVTPHNSLLYVAAESGVLAALALAVAIAVSLPIPSQPQADRSSARCSAWRRSWSTR